MVKDRTQELLNSPPAGDRRTLALSSLSNHRPVYELTVEENSGRARRKRPFWQKPREAQEYDNTDDEADVVPRHVEELQKMVLCTQRDIAVMRQYTQQLARLHTDALRTCCPTPEIRKQMDDLTASTRSASRQVARSMKELQAMKLPPGTRRRMQGTQLSFLTGSFSAALEQHEKELVRYQTGLVSLMTQQMQIVGRGSNRNSTEIDRLLEEGKLQVFVDNYQATVEEEKTRLSDLMGRRNDFFKVEKALKEVQELFQDLGNLILVQGVQIDTIEAHVLASAVAVVRGKEETTEARSKQKAYRKKKIWIAVIILVVVLILLIVLLI